MVIIFLLQSLLTPRVFEIMGYFVYTNSDSDI